MCAERRGATEGGSAAPGSGSAAESPGSAWTKCRASRLFAVLEVCAKFNSRKMPLIIIINFFLLIDQVKIKGKGGKTFKKTAARNTELRSALCTLEA